MTDEKTINGMKQKELLELVRSTIIDINSIHTAVDKIKLSETKAIASEGLINSDDGILHKIQASWEEISGKLKVIQNAYDEIIGDPEDKNWTAVKQLLDELVVNFKADEERIKNFRMKIFWSEVKNPDWTVTPKNKWLEKELDEFLTSWKTKYDQLINDIETKLLPWATSVELAKIFTTKVGEFKSSTNKWTWILITILISITVYFGIDLIFNPGTEILEYKSLWIHMLYRAPFLAFAIWLIKTISDSRAESKKLEESYKHKEIMAISYMWYKKAIIELDAEDSTLMEKHMDNLLSAINQDSSKFLNSTWANHPFLAAIMALFWKNQSEK